MGGRPYQSDMNAYFLKLSRDGSELLRATFFGTGQKFRDLDIDEEASVYGVRHDPLYPNTRHRDTWRQ